MNKEAYPVTSATFILSAFGDEIADDLSDQLRVLDQLGIGFLELRAAWGKNILTMDDDEVAAVRKTCAEYAIAVSCIGSPIGKSPIEAPIEQEAANLGRVFRVADALDTRLVRIFSFYPPETEERENYDSYLEPATSRLTTLTEMAERDGFTLLLENERAIVGDTLARCHAIVSAIESPHLRFLWDPANFIVIGEGQPTDRGWASLGGYVAHVHVKDATLRDRSICPAGEGDGQIGALLSSLKDTGYRGFLALEPHLAHAGPSGGYSGPEGMSLAATALRRVMAQAGCQETVLNNR